MKLALMMALAAGGFLLATGSEASAHDYRSRGRSSGFGVSLNFGSPSGYGGINYNRGYGGGYHHGYANRGYSNFAPRHQSYFPSSGYGRSAYGYSSPGYGYSVPSYGFGRSRCGY